MSAYLKDHDNMNAILIGRTSDIRELQQFVNYIQKW